MRLRVASPIAGSSLRTMTATRDHISSSFKQALIYGGSGLLGKAVGFVMLPVYAQYLGDEGYGVLGMIDVVVTFLALLIGYGVSGAMTRFYYEVEDQERRNVVVSTTIILMALMVFAITLPGLFLNETLGRLAFGREGWGYYIVLALLTFMANMTGQTAENYVVIRQKPMLFASLALARLVVDVSLNIYLVVMLDGGIEGWLYASLIVAFIYAVAIHGLVLWRVGTGFDRDVARRILAFSLPMLPGYLAMFVRGNADRIMLRTWLGLGQLGVFEMLYKFVSLIGFFAVEPFLKSWMVKVFEVCDTAEGPKTLAKAFTYHMALICGFVLLLSLEIPIVLKLLTPAEFWLTGMVVFLAVLSRGILGAYYHVFFGLLYAKKTFSISIVQGCTAAVSVVLNWLLIGSYGLLGAVVASLLTVLVQCAIAYFLARRHYRIPFEWNRVAWILGLTVAMFLVAKDFTVSESSLNDWIVSHFGPVLEGIGSALNLDRIKEGRLLEQVVDRSALAIDAVLVLAYSGGFVLALMAFRVIPTRSVLGSLRWAGKA